MDSAPTNRLRSHREQAGLSQQELALAVGMSRQSVVSVESGRQSPSVDVALRMADVLGCGVEELFGPAQPSGRLLAEPAFGCPDGRVALSQIGGRWVSYPLCGSDIGRAADGIALKTRGKKTEIEPLRPSRLLQDNTVLLGCAPALGLLADRLNSRAGAGRFLWFSRSSTEALTALGCGHSHLAGVHLTDEKTGEANLPDVRRHLLRKPIELVTLARWEVGILTAAGNPKRIRSLAEVSRHRLVSRERGSGARRLLERELTRHGVSIKLAQQAPMMAHGHLAVATAISMGAADVGIASRDAAQAYGLHFQPLTEERYDLVLPRSLLADLRMVRMLELLHSASFQRELTALGYDARPCGQRIVELVT